ncbi:MAG TPA: SRPBCC family protein [Acidimicrobiales bacterium]|nr:SRPBCC family protein [Acidimicrobiales bacterium]
MPEHYVVEREQRIHASPAAVQERIVDFRRWQAWSPWEDVDPALRRSYSGAPSGVGAVYEWEGNRKAGKGRMEITSVEPDRSVAVDLQFLKPFKAHNVTTFTTEQQGDDTLVRWSMTGPRTFMTRVMGIFSSMDKMIGPDFEKGLDRLKADVEAG